MIRVPLTALQAAARFLLVNANRFAWTLQGMGMLRIHMHNARLHVWDRSYATPGVSMIHDHLQWSLRSTILAGSLINQRYVECYGVEHAIYNSVTLKAGAGCKFMQDPKLTRLRALAPESYFPGDTYSQQPSEIHETKPQGIVVTLMEKVPTGTDLARVFWPFGTEWGTAEPRRASPDEVAAITRKAILALDAAMELAP